MSDVIPDNVMDAAVVAFNTAIDMDGYEGSYEVIARAILAERERCAQVAYDAHDEWVNDSSLWGKDGMHNVQKTSIDMAQGAAIIAGRINNG